MTRAAIVLASLLFPLAATADVLVLRGGSRLSFARCVEETERVVCHTDAGTVSFPRGEVLQLLRGESEQGVEPTWRAPRREEPAADRDAFGTSSPGTLELTLEAFSREQSGDWSGAERAYRRALELQEGFVTARIGLARTLLRQARPYEAVDELEAVVADQPDLAPAHALLGEAYDALDRLPDAVRCWERAARLDESFAERYEKGRRELETQRDFDRALAPHFTVHYDGDRDEPLGEAVLEALEDAFDEFVTRFEHYPENTILVILYSRQDFEEVTGAGPDVGGLFDGKVRLPVGGLRSVTPEVEAVVRHELAHAFLHDKGKGRVPRWLHEGLAQRVEGLDASRLRGSLLRAASANEDPIAWASTFTYAKALSQVEWIEAEYGKGRLLDLVVQLGEGGGEDEAIVELFGVNRERLLGEWLDALRRGGR